MEKSSVAFPIYILFDMSILNESSYSQCPFFGEFLLFGVFSLLFRKELFKNFIVLSVCAVAALGISSYAIANLCQAHRNEPRLYMSSGGA